jgi:tetratricopeptide (TPR) repeat protein
MPSEAIADQVDVQGYLDVLRRAEEATAAEHWADAAALWGRVVELNPVNGAFWLQLGITHYRAQQYREASSAFTQALELGGTFPAPAYEYNFLWRVAYDIARCYAMLQDKDLALHWLERALSLGWRPRDAARTEPAFSLLRDDSRFDDLIGIAESGSLTHDAGWQSDLALLAREIKRLHYAPFRQVSEQAFDAMVRRLHDAIPHLTEPQIFVELMKLVRQLGDGHSSVVFWQERPEFHAVPMTFYLFTEGLFITAAATPYVGLVGMQVLEVGAHPVDAVLTALDQIVSQDNPMWAKLLAPFFLQQPYLLHGLGLIPDSTTLPLTVRAHDDAVQTILLPADTSPIFYFFGFNPPESWTTVPQQAPGAPPLYLKDSGFYWFEYLVQDKAVYFQCKRVRENPDEPFGAFCQRLFAFVNDNEVEKLIIDLRRNAGGNTFLHRPLLRGLMQNEKINQRGKLFVIIGRNTFSAAMNGSTLIEDYTNAIFVGEPTGASPNFVGETTIVRLPYSQLEVSISDLYWQTSWPMDHRSWIAPRLYIPPSFAAYRVNRDPALEAILAYSEP